MAITKKIVYTHHRFDKYRIRYKRWTHLIEDGQEIGVSCKTFTITPEDDWTVDDYQNSGEPVPDDVIAMCKNNFTDAIKTSYDKESVINEKKGEATGPSFDTVDKVE